MNVASDSDLETDEAWENSDAMFFDTDMDAESKAWRQHEQAELRYTLGLDDASGYHVVDTEADALDDGVSLLPWPIIADGPEDMARGQEAPASFPCLDGARYSGCLGLACPLETCWTGAATVSSADRMHRMREESRVSATLYVPGAPCHGCSYLREDVAPPCKPRADGTRRVRHGATGDEKEDEPAVPGEPAARRRITCAQGLWAYPISLASFVTRRIPMRDQDDPRHCPCFAPRAAPHPSVVAHLQRRRERTRQLREERREYEVE
ncbi:MAG: hypothetical protein LC769_02280 [Chloroflexi bacterium]|nr:hypothetical protein [Chloroflexota bacterium]